MSEEHEILEMPEPMRQILEQADAARRDASRRSYERWLERMRPRG